MYATPHATVAPSSPEPRIRARRGLDGALFLSGEGTALYGTLRGPADVTGCVAAEARCVRASSREAGPDAL